VNFVKIKNALQNFWLFQIFGWLIYAIIFYLFFFWRTIEETSDFVGFSITIISGFVFSSIMRFIYKRIGYQDRSILQISVLVIGVSIVSSLVWYWTDSFLSMFNYGFETVTTFLATRSFLFYLSSSFYYSAIFISWSALYFFINFWNEWQIQRERTQKANHLAQSAQLQMLRYQLNPHFLFNSLNSIRALIDEDKTSAKSMVTDLSEFLRYSLINKDDATQLLSNEIEAIKIYSTIQKRRYEDNLDISFDIDPSAKSFPVPNFLFHPLIENAIKYGMKTSEMPLKIRVKANIVNEALKIEVSNSGNWVKTTEKDRKDGTGTGLYNIKRRLDNVFPKKYNIKIEDDNNWVQINIQINKDAVIQNEEII